LHVTLYQLIILLKSKI